MQYKKTVLKRIRRPIDIKELNLLRRGLIILDTPYPFRGAIGRRSGASPTGACQERPGLARLPHGRPSVHGQYRWRDQCVNSTQPQRLDPQRCGATVFVAGRSGGFARHLRVVATRCLTIPRPQSPTANPQSLGASSSLETAGCVVKCRGSRCTSGSARAQHGGRTAGGLRAMPQRRRSEDEDAPAAR